MCPSQVELESVNSETLADQAGALWNNPSGCGRGERLEEGLELAVKCPSPEYASPIHSSLAKTSLVHAC